MNEFQFKKLNELCVRITDGSHYSPVGVESGFPMLSVKDMLDNSFSYESCKYISEKDYLDLVKSDCKPLLNDVLIAKDGSYLKHVFVIKKEIEQAILSSIGILRPDLKKVVPEYLKYYLQTSSVKETVAKKYVSGSALPRIILKNFGAIDIIYKDLKTQQKIASVLSALDSKIELNNKINAELEALAKTIYDYWFVQFDFPCLPENYKFSGAGKPTNFESCLTYRQVGGLPVPDGKKWFVYVLLCDDGSFYKGMTNDLYRRYYEHVTGQGAQHTKIHKPVKVIHWEAFDSQGEAAAREKDLKTGFGRTWLQREYEYLLNHKPGLPAHQNARPSKLMPAGKMVWSEELKREIPEGWEVKTLNECMRIVRGASPRPIDDFISNSGAPWIKISDATSINHWFIVSTKEFIKEDGVRHSRELQPGTLILSNSASPGIPRIVQIRSCVHDGWLIVDTFQKGLYNEFMLFYFENFRSKILNMGSGSIFKNLKTEYIKDLLITLPSTEMLSSSRPIFQNISDQILNNVKENQKLSELRDWLLPMLMNGQVKVSER